jgi:peptidoglycan/LPS O-acetylase OafA/YrhL
METKERIKWLDGLKGLACLLVFVHHFLLSFFSAAYFGVESHTRLHGYDTYLASAPIGVFANGNFQVCVFLLIAAFLPAKRIMECRKEDLQDVAGRMLLKRYPRLMIPVFSVCAMNYVILFLVNRLGLNYMGTELSYHGYSYFLHSLYDLFLVPDTGLLGPLWSISYIFLGSVTAIALAIPAKKERWYLPLVYLVIVRALVRQSIQFMPCVLGVMLADLIVNERVRIPWTKRRGILASVALIAGGLFLGGYPSYVKPENIYSKYYPTVALRVVPSMVQLPLGTSNGGWHTLTLHPKDPGIVFEKVVVDCGGYQPSFLFMEESPKTKN